VVELITLNYLKEQLTVPVYMMEPTNKNPEGNTFVVIQKTGSSVENHIYTSTIAIQSYAPTLYEAAVLNEEVKEAMKNIIDLDEITKVLLNSDYAFIKTSTKQPRYQAVFDLTHYGG
jgi:hypothetical protein